MGRIKLRLGEWGEITTHRIGTEANPWVARTYFRDFDGRRRLVERSGNTRSAARKRLQQAVEERSRKRSGTGLSSGFTVKESWVLYRKQFEQLVRLGRKSEGTLDTYTYQAEKNLLNALGDLRLLELDTPLIEAYLLDLCEHVGPPTARTCKTILNGILSMAVRHGALATNPTRDVSPIVVQSKPAISLSLEDRKNWFIRLADDEKAHAEDLYDLTCVLFATGLRIGEVLGLIWHNIDLDHGLLTVEAKIQRVKGKGLVRSRPKSRAGDREIELPQWCVDILKNRLTDETPADEPVFPTILGTFRDTRNVHRALQEARKRIGFPHVTPHSWRKTNATVLDEAGATAREIADRLGHARISMTQDAYMGRGHRSSRPVVALEKQAPPAKMRK